MKRVLAFAVLACGCESAVNLDVTYHDASAEASTGDAGASDAAAPDADAAEAAAVDGGSCGCDVSAGLGCCIPKTGAPFCTGDLGACATAAGMLVRCTGPDPGSDSVCCWHGAAAGASTAYAAACTGPTACASAADCNGQPCTTTTCGGVTVGQCGTSAPTCP